MMLSSGSNRDSERYTEQKTKETLEAQAKQGIKTVDFGADSARWPSISTGTT